MAETSNIVDFDTSNVNAIEVGYQSTDILGCQHYQKKCRVRASCCQKFYTCRLCHDADANHEINRY